MKPDVVVVFAFGSQETAANERLCRKAEVFGKMGVPIFTQCDIPIEWGTVFFAEEILKRRRGWLKEGHMSTLLVVCALDDVIWGRGWRKILVLAAPQHMGRCVRDLRRGLAHPEVAIIVPYRWKLPWRWYDQCSREWHVRGPIRWWFREMILRLSPWVLYRQIAEG